MLIEAHLAEKDMDAEMSSSNLTSGLPETQREGQNVVVVAFDATVKEISHAGIVWAMEHVLKKGDILTIVSVLDFVRGHRMKIGYQKWLRANQKLMEEKMEVWRNFPGLENRCAEEGVKLVVQVKAAQRGEIELAICKEAMKLRASHVVLDKSLKNKRREFYRQNISCNVTRMRRRGGVDVIRPSLDMATMKSPTSDPTLWFPPRLLSYDDQIDEFEISLGVPIKTKRLNSRTPISSPPLPSPNNSGELKSGELPRLPRSPILATAHEHSSTISQAAYGRASSESSVNRPSFTSNSDATDDDLFSILHGSTHHTETDIDLFRKTDPNSEGYESDDLFSIDNDPTRHTEMDINLFSNMNLSSSGYESDDLFSICNASTRRTSTAPTIELYHHSHNSQPLRHSYLHSSSSSIPDSLSTQHRHLPRNSYNKP